MKRRILDFKKEIAQREKEEVFNVKERKNGWQRDEKTEKDTKRHNNA